MNSIDKKKLTLIIGGTLILLVIIIGLIYIFNKKEDKELAVKQPEKIDEMVDYEYYLEEDATKYYKKLYEELKDILNEDEINEEEYAKKVSQLFVADLFTLDNKVTSSDIGGLQFVYTDFKEDFINIAKTTLYSNIESNIYGDRTQTLPIVNSVEIIEINSGSFDYQNKEYDSYDVSLKIKYEKDLDYPSEYQITLIKNDKYLQVACAK